MSNGGREVSFNGGKPQPKKESQMLRPLADRVIVERVAAQTMTKGGIALPEVAQDKPQKGRVIAVGPGKPMVGGHSNDSFVRVPTGLKKGDFVLFRRHSGHDIEIDGKELLILSESEILAVIED